MGTQILTGTHISASETFEYIDYPVVLEDNVWTGINSIIMPGVHMSKGSILSAGSVLIKQNVIQDDLVIYSGNPAVKISNRNLGKFYTLGKWKPHFR